MYHYRHFDDEIDPNPSRSSAILAESDEIEHELDIFPSTTTVRPSSKTCRIFQNRTKLEILLLISILCLIVVSIIFSYIPSLKVSPPSICTSSICVQMSSSILSSIENEVEPCDDFYQFACGNWAKTHTIPSGQPSWSIIRERNELNLILLKNLLENDFSSNKIEQNNAKKFYRSCLNQNELEKIRLDAFENFLQTVSNFSINKWIQLDSNQTKLWFNEILRIFIINFDFSTFLPISVDPDPKNSSFYAIHINEPRLVLSSRDYYVDKTNPKNQRIMQTYEKVGVDILRLLGFPESDANQRMREILRLETDLAEIIPPMETLQDPRKSSGKMTISQLNEHFKNVDLDMKSLLNDLVNKDRSEKIELTENQSLNIISIELIDKLKNFLVENLSDQSKSRSIVDHCLFSMIFSLRYQLPIAFQQAILPLKKELLGTESLLDRWKTCVEQTDFHFRFALASMFIESISFSDSDRAKSIEIIQNLRTSFQRIINDADWIDSSTKNEALNKLNKITKRIAYPPFINDQNRLKNYYDNYTMTEDSYLKNHLKVLELERRRSLLRFGKPIDSDDWQMTIATVNAYYSPSSNEIVFPAGILQIPFFHKDLPAAINFGAIGTIIGHELSHAFDNQGREYDANGNLRIWWTNESLSNYERKSQCFVKQYGNFQIGTEQINGQRTLGENLADNVGLKVAFQAFGRSGFDQISLPALNFTSEQLFFIAFAQNWCSIETESSIHYNIVIDPHTPAKYRVLGTLKNSEQFSRAFSCSPKKSMNPEEKCSLW